MSKGTKGFLVVVIICSLLAIILTGCNNAKVSGQSANPNVQHISIDEAIKEWRNKEVLFIDVRTAEEYKQGHVPGAKLIPLSDLESRRDEVPKDKKVLLICRSGARSAQANLILQKLSFVNTYSVNGGMLEWRGAIEN